MKKNIYLGITNDNNCCVLYSLADFDLIKNNLENIESSDFTHYATNWSGKDLIERTLSKMQLSLTGREIKLLKPITFAGCDYDMGHEYGWVCRVYSIKETKMRDA